MSMARKDKKVAKAKKKNTSLDLKKRLQAATLEASSEILQRSLADEKKMKRLQAKKDELERKTKLRLMRDLARSTEVLVASLKSDNVDVQEYFRERELEDRREAWMLRLGDMKTVEETPSIRSKATTTNEDADEDDAMRMETELERRARLRREAKEARDNLENIIEEREEKELERINFLKQQLREHKKKLDRDKKIEARDGRDWILNRKNELNVQDHRKAKEEQKEESKRKLHFDKYYVKLQNKESRARRAKENEWKEREEAEEKVRLLFCLLVSLFVFSCYFASCNILGR